MRSADSAVCPPDHCVVPPFRLCRLRNSQTVSLGVASFAGDWGIRFGRAGERSCTDSLDDSSPNVSTVDKPNRRIPFTVRAFSMTTATDYQVKLDIFHGPMDLLLYLVRRNEINPLDFRITTIVDQFVEFLEVLQFLDLDIVGDFIVMASSLVEIKSRLVLPQPEEPTDTEELIEDPEDAGLIQQLLQYKQYKDASNALENRAAEWQERYPRLSDDRPKAGKDPAADLIREVELWDLVAALSRILKYKEVEEDTSILYDDTPISVHSERIRQRIAEQGQVAFSDFFDGEKARGRIVGLFLAILELLRHYQYRAVQEEWGEIWILPPLDDTAANDPDGEIAVDARRNDATPGVPGLSLFEDCEVDLDEAVDHISDEEE